MTNIKSYINDIKEMHNNILINHINSNYSHLNFMKTVSLLTLVRKSMDLAKFKNEHIVTIVIPEEYWMDNTDYVNFVADVLFLQGYDFSLNGTILTIDVSYCKF